jgi:glycolate dehydrogenase FAD-binding subunit
MSTTLPALTAALARIAGVEVRAAIEADAVAGVLPRVVVAPAHAEAVAATLAFANDEGLAVLPRGGGAQMGLGAPPARGDILLSLHRLDAVVEHNPGDITATFQPGLPLMEAQRALAGARQWLALDPDLAAGATIGGIVATNATGARRLRYGGVRDQIIGVRVALADGTLASGGGKVVKNVAGYDLPKLFTGALGTLGVIVAATFRLYPLPAATGTVAVEGDAPTLCALAVRVSATQLMPAALDVVGGTAHGAACRLLARFDSTPAAVAEQAAQLAALARASGLDAVRTLSDAEAEAAWSASLVEEAAASPAILLQASLLPTDVAPWLAALGAHASTAGITTRWRAHVGHGIVHARLGGPAAALLDAPAPLRAVAVERRGSLVVRDAPSDLAGKLDIWGTSPALDVMRRLKASFDPRGTLNPGRFIGGI